MADNTTYIVYTKISKSHYIIVSILEWIRGGIKRYGWWEKAVEGSNGNMANELFQQVNQRCTFIVVIIISFSSFSSIAFSNVNSSCSAGPTTSTPGPNKRSRRSLFLSPSVLSASSLEHVSVSERYCELYCVRIFTQLHKFIKHAACVEILPDLVDHVSIRPWFSWLIYIDMWIICLQNV